MAERHPEFPLSTADALLVAAEEHLHAYKLARAKLSRALTRGDLLRVVDADKDVALSQEAYTVACNEYLAEIAKTPE